MSQSLYSSRKNPWYIVDRRMEEPLSQSEHSGDENAFPSAEIQAQSHTPYLTHYMH
jgi:hypothetical protein